MYKFNIKNVFGPRILYIKDLHFLPLYGSTSRRNLSLGWNAPLLLTGKEPWPCTDGNLRIDVCDRIIQIRFVTPSKLLKFFYMMVWLVQDNLCFGWKSFSLDIICYCYAICKTKFWDYISVWKSALVFILQDECQF